MTPPDPMQVQELKKGLWQWLLPRIVIGVGVFVLAALYIFWPR